MLEEERGFCVPEVSFVQLNEKLFFATLNGNTISNSVVSLQVDDVETETDEIFAEGFSEMNGMLNVFFNEASALLFVAE